MKKLIYLVLIVLISACSTNSLSGIEGTWTGTFVIPPGPYTPNGDDGTFSVSIGPNDMIDSDLYLMDGTITSNFFNETYELGLEGSFERNSSGDWEFDMAPMFGNTFPNIEIYFFTAAVVGDELINGIITTNHTPDGTFTGNKN